MDSKRPLWSLIVRLNVLNIVQHGHALNDAAERHILTVHPGSRCECNVELGAVRVGSCVGQIDRTQIARYLY